MNTRFVGLEAVQQESCLYEFYPKLCKNDVGFMSSARNYGNYVGFMSSARNCAIGKLAT
jgi:hypothetical protein